MKTKRLSILFTTLLILNSATAQEYTVAEIQLSGNVQSASPSCINNNGVVVGRCYIPSYGYYGFIYEKGIFNLINFSGRENYHPKFAVNDLNNFTGTVYFPGFVYKGFFNYEFLPGLDPDYSFGRDINNLNHIVGDGSDGQNYFIVIYDGTEIINTFDLGTENGSDLRAINDSGFVTGNDWFPNNPLPYIYNYNTSQLVYLPDISSGDEEANDINNLNQVVGYYEHSGTSWSGFIWEGSSYTYLPDKSYPHAINDSGVVVGEFRPSTYPPQHAFVYDPVNGFRDLNDLIPSGSGWELLEATDINDVGQITGGGFLNGEVKSFILTPNKLTVTKPLAGELFIAGEKDTIKWIGGGDVDSIKITAILNWHTTFSTEVVIRESIPTDSGFCIWNIPDTLLSYKTKIKIEDKTDPVNFGESASFRLKGYIYTRLNPINQTYEAFERTTHAWQFGNSGTNMWPPTWWSQFNYNTSTDPYTGSSYSDDFVSEAPNQVPDWLAFVRAFGVNQCYWSVPVLGLYYRQNAINFWKGWRSNWGGSCFGFAITSILAFQDVTGFVIAYPEMPPFNNLYQFPSPLTGIQGDSIRYIINSSFWHQVGKQHWNDYLFHLGNVTPTQTLNKLKGSLLDDDGDGRVLRIEGVFGAHAIMVYKVKQSQASSNIYTLSVYDNSFPGSNNATITIDTAANGGNGNWTSLLWNHQDVRGIILLDSANTYLSPPIIPNGPLDTESRVDENFVVNNSKHNDILITASNGNSIGFVNDSLINNIPNALSHILMEPSNLAPSQYYLPPDNYKVKLNSFIDTTCFFYFNRENLFYNYRRNDAALDQSDNLYIGSGLSFTSNDHQIKRIELKTGVCYPDYEKIFFIPSVEIFQIDSIYLEAKNENEMDFKNFGNQKNYDLRIRYNSNSFIKLFSHNDINLTQNSAHTIIPVWDDLENQDVKILIDDGNDGTIDDSIFIKNQATDVKDQGFGVNPDKYYLAQNYPNPFNPVTTIKYSLPVQSFVTIKVYDILGAEVSTLVNEEKSVGNYEVEFDGSKSTSGIYFYQIKAGNFVETKKMILLK